MHTWLKVGGVLFAIVCVGLLIYSLVMQQTTSYKGTPTDVQTSVAAVADGSRSHVMLLVDGQLIQVSTGSANHTQPTQRGDFIVWLEVPQEHSEKYVVRYHIPTETELRLTTSGVSQFARVNTQGAVVWQQWVDDTWQIFYFDGEQTRQITAGNTPHIHPDIYEHRVAYAEQDSAGEWLVVEQDVTTGSLTTIINSAGEKYPHYLDGVVSFTSPQAAIILETDE